MQNCELTYSYVLEDPTSRLSVGLGFAKAHQASKQASTCTHPSSMSNAIEQATAELLAATRSDEPDAEQITAMFVVDGGGGARARDGEPPDELVVSVRCVRERSQHRSRRMRSGLRLP